ncbi:MAG: FAD-dependent oxidoreductase [bacterium]|nr:FAD-dependent oxidoreductase [bacterium]
MKMENSHTMERVSRDKLDRKWLEVNIPCQEACPIRTDIPGYIEAIKEGDYQKAYMINRMDNVLPGSLGRVCNRPCEPVCRHGRGDLGDPVAICFLKRSAADFGAEPVKIDITPNGKKVCIIGAGPAGLTTANDLALKGYDVTILEQYEEPGGMLRYGIPQFRLPPDVVAADVKSITDLGVTLKTGHRINSDEEVEQLKKDYDAVVLAGGCMLPKLSRLPNMDKPGVYWGLDFMMETNRDRLEVDFNKVIVIGGGFTAVDCTRMSYRMGAKEVLLAYRRTKDDMYVSHHELDAMEAEGVELSFLISPVSIEIKDGKTCGVKFVRNSIAEDRSITPIEGSEFTIDTEAVIFAIGQQAEENLKNAKNITRKGNFFVAGDFRNGSSTVIEAAADGREMGKEVHKHLSGIKGYEDVVLISEVESTGRKRIFDFIPLQHMDQTPLYERMEKKKEVETGFSKEKSLEEAKRCYLCHYNFQIDIDRCIYCLACISVMPVGCIKMAKDIEIGEDGDLKYIETTQWSEVQAITIDNDACIRCGNCVRACPVDCISISKYQLQTRKIK